MYLYAVFTVTSEVLLAGIAPSPFKKRSPPKLTPGFLLDKGLNSSLGKIGYNLILVSKIFLF